MQHKRVHTLALFLSIGFGLFPVLAFSQIPGQTAPNQGGKQGNNQPQVAGQKTPDQPNNPGKNPPQVANQKAPSDSGASDHPHTVAKAPTGPVQPMIPWDGKVADPKSVPPNFNPGQYKALQMGMMQKAEAKAMGGQMSGQFPASVFPAPTSSVPPTFADRDSAFNYYLKQLNSKLDEQEAEQLKIWKDLDRPEEERKQARKELQTIFEKKKANWGEVYQKVMVGKDPCNGYYGKTYPGMDKALGGALILLGLNGK